ncbi:aspartate/glutamate racemase family protein [Antrihabitans sp. YC2-6]|uniref:aspartate/glutamate racemase family protein n=1 Tax=Antrihabitans sp. YC2-6 TaxID=2799498 RepID=UPI0018F49BCC|nr:aspartate/glutamate racemase family protein [Antrihabitans sp. YC2-6]MBJ8343122.1 aspartate/glutamate racemase family protein [Antrihabitans sp. YC2-6]
MRIKIVNPNTTLTMTSKIGACARAVAGPGTLIEAVSPDMGPASIESHYDEALSVPGLLAEIVKGEQSGFDGYVIACFGDPGLEAAREIARGPVIGIAEAAMHLGSFLGRSFSVVTTLERSAGRTWELAEKYGMARFCKGVHACEIAVLALDTDPDARKVVTETALRAVEIDKSDAVLLGCAGMADLCQEISDKIGVPVIDGVAAATLLVESMLRLGLRKSGRGEFATPIPKVYSGILSAFGG